jgi:hypothetical protein
MVCIDYNIAEQSKMAAESNEASLLLLPALLLARD